MVTISKKKNAFRPGWFLDSSRIRPFKYKCKTFSICVSNKNIGISKKKE